MQQDQSPKTNNNPGASERKVYPGPEQQPFTDPNPYQQTYQNYGPGPQQQQQTTPPPGYTGNYGQPYGYAPEPPQEVQEKARNASILLRIGGWINIFSGAMSLLGILLLAFGSSIFYSLFANEIAGEAALAAGITTFVLVVLGIFLAINGGVSLWFGITAVKHHADNQKIQFLFVAGIIQAVFAVLGIIGTRSLTGILGIAAAGTYLAGAIMKKQLYQPF